MIPIFKNRRGPFELINQFLLFQYSQANFCVKKRLFCRNVRALERPISRSIFCESVKLAAPVGKEKVAFEYVRALERQLVGRYFLKV